jgi:hypothetical protein
MREISSPHLLRLSDLIRQERADKDAVIADLVEALEEAKSGLMAFTGGSEGSCQYTIQKIDAALAKAKGEVA